MRYMGENIQKKFLLLLFKPASHTQVGKKLFINCFHNLQAPAPRKTEKNTTQGSNVWLNAHLNPSNVKQGVGKVIPRTNLSRQ